MTTAPTSSLRCPRASGKRGRGWGFLGFPVQARQLQQLRAHPLERLCSADPGRCAREAACGLARHRPAPAPAPSSPRRVGTLDSLLALSDDLAKVNQAVEGTVNKVRRQLMELQASVAPEDRADVWVETQTPEGYLQRFAWNEAKYPSRRPLKEIVASIMDNVQKLDDDLKVRLQRRLAAGLGGQGWAGRGWLRVGYVRRGKAVYWHACAAALGAAVGVEVLQPEGDRALPCAGGSSRVG